MPIAYSENTEKAELDLSQDRGAKRISIYSSSQKSYFFRLTMLKEEIPGQHEKFRLAVFLLMELPFKSKR